MPNLLQLQDLYSESIIREIIEKTKGGGIVWSQTAGNQFSASYTKTVDSVSTVWGFYLTKTQIGNLTYNYTLDIKKNGVTYISEAEGTLLYTSRDNIVRELYKIVEVIVLELDLKLKETLTVIQNLATALTNGILP